MKKKAKIRCALAMEMADLHPDTPIYEDDVAHIDCPHELRALRDIAEKARALVDISNDFYVPGWRAAWVALDNALSALRAARSDSSGGENAE